MVQLPEASGIAETPGRTTPAPGVTEWPANEREDAAHAIAYGTKTKLAGAFKNQVDLWPPRCITAATVGA